MNTRKITFQCLLVLIMQAVVSSPVRADIFSAWRTGNGTDPSFNTPQQLCDYLYYEVWPGMTSLYRPENNGYDSPILYSCGYSANGLGKLGLGHLMTLNCSEGQRPNAWYSSCVEESTKGVDEGSLVCSSPSTLAGNPINFTYGNKIQNETDLESKTMKVSRFYNSADGLWRHNFSTHLFFSDRSVVMVLSDGKEHSFSPGSEDYTSGTDLGILKKDGDSWRYTGPDQKVLSFSLQGDLTEIDNPGGVVYKLNYTKKGAGREVVIRNSYGELIVLLETSTRQLKSVQGAARNLVFVYNDSQRLIERRYTVDGIVSVRQYHYENNYNPDLLTGITDERGVRFATWAYDIAGRAISSQHASSAGVVKITYRGDQYRVVTNELGKETAYRYELISGINRLVEIKGEPTPDCPASNSSYTYNERGQVLTKTDAKGLITTYDYNGRGLETSRTEASGTTLARTVTTEWDPERFLPTRVTEPDRITTFSYDVQGRELSRQTTSR